MASNISSEQAVEHAWKYFELHSNQRITLFNRPLAKVKTASI